MNRENDIFKDSSGKLERFLNPDLNIDLIEVIARGRAKPTIKQTGDSPANKLDGSTTRQNQTKPSREGSKDLATLHALPKDDHVISTDQLGEAEPPERDEEEYLNKILNDTQYLIDESAGDGKLKRQGTMGTIHSSELGREHPFYGQDISERIKDQERARQDALNHLFHQVVLDKIVKEEKNSNKPVSQLMRNADMITELKLESIRGFRTLQYMRIPAKIINDNTVLEEMLKNKHKKDVQDEKVKNLMGNLNQKGRSGIQVSQSLISLSSQLQPGFSGKGALPPSKLLDLNRRNKLITTHQALSNQIQQSSKYLYSSKAKLDKLKLAHKKLLECYQIKKEQIVEKIRKINRHIKKLQEKNESKLLDNEESIFSPNRKLIKTIKDINMDNSVVHTESEVSPFNQRATDFSFKNLSQAVLSQSPGTDSLQSPSKKLVTLQHVSMLIDDESEDSEDMFGEAAKMMAKNYLKSSNAHNRSNSDAVYEILKGDLKRTKLMTEKQLNDLVDHMKENLGIKKDYLDSLAKYVLNLEDTLQKTQTKQRNMYVFLLEHPKDIT